MRSAFCCSKRFATKNKYTNSTGRRGAGIAGRKIMGSNPNRVQWDILAVNDPYPEMDVLWARWESSDMNLAHHTNLFALGFQAKDQFEPKASVSNLSCLLASPIAIWKVN